MRSGRRTAGSTRHRCGYHDVPKISQHRRRRERLRFGDVGGRVTDAALLEGALFVGATTHAVITAMCGAVEAIDSVATLIVVVASVALAIVIDLRDSIAHVSFTIEPREVKEVHSAGSTARTVPTPLLDPSRKTNRWPASTRYGRNLNRTRVRPVSPGRSRPSAGENTAASERVSK